MLQLFGYISAASLFIIIVALHLMLSLTLRPFPLICLQRLARACAT